MLSLSWDDSIKQLASKAFYNSPDTTVPVVLLSLKDLYMWVQHMIQSMIKDCDHIAGHVFSTHAFLMEYSKVNAGSGLVISSLA